MRVYNMVSVSSGREVANQFIIEGDNKVTFQSYSSMIAELDFNNHVLTIGEDWDYSTTTGKYRNSFFADYMPQLDNKKAIMAVKNGKETVEGWEVRFL